MSETAKKYREALKDRKPISIAELKAYRGFEHYSDAQAKEALLLAESLTRIAYRIFQQYPD